MHTLLALLIVVVVTTTTTAYPLSPPPPLHHLFMNCNNPICSTNGMYGFHCKNGLCSYVCSEAGCRPERLDFRPQPTNDAYNVIFCGCENPSCSMDGFHGYGCAHGACHYICSDYGCIDVSKETGVSKRPKKAQVMRRKGTEVVMIEGKEMGVSITTPTPVSINTPSEVVIESTTTKIPEMAAVKEPAKADLNKTSEIKVEKGPRRMRKRLLKKRPKNVGRRIEDVIKSERSEAPEMIRDATRWPNSSKREVNHFGDEMGSKMVSEEEKEMLKKSKLNETKPQGRKAKRQSKIAKLEEKVLSEVTEAPTGNPRLTTNQTKTPLVEAEAKSADETVKSTVKPQKEIQTKKVERRRRRTGHSHQKQKRQK